MAKKLTLKKSYKYLVVKKGRRGISRNKTFLAQLKLSLKGVTNVFKKISLP